ncbi:MAG: hypothetical protein PHG06_06810 [Parabacteroides sp.]|nr:hypothetical protein [Parabacteroides sp.]
MGEGYHSDASYAEPSLFPFGDNYVLYNYVQKNGSSYHYVYNNENRYTANLPVQIYYTEWLPGGLGYQDRTGFITSVGNSGFGYTTVNTTTNKSTITFYDNGALRWNKVIQQSGNPWHIERTSVIGGSYGCRWRESSTFENATLFKDFVVVSDTHDGAGTQTLLLNRNTGAVECTIPLAYAWNDSNNLFLQKRADDGNGIMLYVYNQLQGLKYVCQVIQDHSWDSTFVNHVVSVTDGAQYPDYDAKRDAIIQLSKADHLNVSGITPSTGSTAAQITDIALNGNGGWWIQTNNNMSVPLGELAAKIIQQVNDVKGADNVVLVNQPVELKSEYKDSENDPASIMNWSFTHDSSKLGDLLISNSMGVSALHGTTPTVPPTSFDKAGTYRVKCKAKDSPVTSVSYMADAKAGAKWSSDAAELIIIAHRKPVAAFTVTATATMHNGFSVTDQSYDPDLVNTDPAGKKGIRNWEWQYRNSSLNEDWISSAVAPTTFNSKGTFIIRLRVQDVHGAWSDWSAQHVFSIVNSKPIAVFDAVPNPVLVNGVCTLFDYSYDMDGDALTDWEWTIQGVGTLNKVNSDPFTVSWSAVGDYLVTLKVKDSEGTWSDPVSQVVSVIVNNKPVARFTLPVDGYTGEMFTADGSASYDPDPEDTLDMSYWQFKKPGGEWSGVITQYLGDSGYLHFNQTPSATELGTWYIRLVVVDNHGLESDPVEHSIEIKEGFEVSGYIIPVVGERGRNMIVVAYAHTPAGEKFQISSMSAYIVHPTKPDGSAALPNGQTPQVVNMVYDAATTTYRYTFLVPNKVQAGRWPDDGTYYIRVVGLKNTTSKETLLPATIKGHIQERLYIKTRSW